MRDKHPELWNELLILNEAENKTTNNFKYGMTLKELEHKMNMIDNQMTIFDLIDEVECE